jgi:hypothetical protein
VHDAEVHERADLAIAKDVFCFLSPEVDLAVFDVLRPIREWTSIEPDDATFTVQHSSHTAPESPADPRDDYCARRHAVAHLGRKEIDAPPCVMSSLDLSALGRNGKRRQNAVVIAVDH